MGDFNDTPDDNSIDEVLGAKKKFEKRLNLSNYIIYSIQGIKRGIGTTYVRVG